MMLRSSFITPLGFSLRYRKTAYMSATDHIVLTRSVGLDHGGRINAWCQIITGAKKMLHVLAFDREAVELRNCLPSFCLRRPMHLRLTFPRYQHRAVGNSL